MTTPAALTVGDQGGGIGHVRALGQGVSGGSAAVVFLHRHRLAGERGFVDLQVAQRSKAQVGGHLVARLERHHVAGHQLGGRQTRFSPARITVASVVMALASASMACSALDSWM